jgi:peroxiredoxin
LIGIHKVTGIILILALLAGFIGVAGCSGGNEELRIGSTAPDFKLNNLDEQSVSLNSVRDKLVFLNFWNTTASTCVKDRPVFQQLSESWSGRNDIVLLTINIGEDKATVKGFMESNEYTFPVLLDIDYNVSAQYAVQYMPTSILIGKDGKIKLNTIGDFKSVSAVEKQIASFLN